MSKLELAKGIEKAKIVPFNIDEVEDMKRKRLQSLCKRIGIKANLGNEDLVEQLKRYYEDNEASLKAAAKAKKEAAKAAKEKREKKKQAKEEEEARKKAAKRKKKKKKKAAK
eukprot:TRINITY_DN520_c0_g2_i1.p2 TRINITY_DN520_c0_g2~~TRINITY_DN520_c0_g2_i1.p2  ORF type:complete len:112 (+),score=55.20 TRINITY_DN520_c0_g2_i1:540-875(+)